MQMNVADKTRLYDEARRVLRPRGRLAIWDNTGASSKCRQRRSELPCRTPPRRCLGKFATIGE